MADVWFDVRFDFSLDPPCWVLYARDKTRYLAESSMTEPTTDELDRFKARATEKLNG